MRKHMRGILAVLALGWLALMYAVGELPRHGHFNEATVDGGVLGIPPEAVKKITLTHAGTRLEAKREGAHWRFNPLPRTPLPLAQRMEAALRYLHVSPPVRGLGHPAQTDPVLAASGLAPAVGTLEVTGETGLRRTFSLGGTAPDGILRYLRDDDSGELHLVSGFVAGAWDDLAKTWKSVPRRAYKR